MSDYTYYDEDGNLWHEDGYILKKAKPAKPVPANPEQEQLRKDAGETDAAKIEEMYQVWGELQKFTQGLEKNGFQNVMNNPLPGYATEYKWDTVIAWHYKFSDGKERWFNLSKLGGSEQGQEVYYLKTQDIVAEPFWVIAH